MNYTANFYNTSLQGHEATEECARDYARGMVWSEIETTTQTIKYLHFIDSINGIDIYYCYGTDSYLFAEGIRETF